MNQRAGLATVHCSNPGGKTQVRGENLKKNIEEIKISLKEILGKKKKFLDY